MKAKEGRWLSAELSDHEVHGILREHFRTKWLEEGRIPEGCPLGMFSATDDERSTLVQFKESGEMKKLRDGEKVLSE